MTANQVRINTLALGARLPTMDGVREGVEAGSLMSYGANFPALYRRTADIVDRILRGTKPADIPVEQPTKFDLDQPDHRQSPRPHHPGNAAGHRRRGDSIVPDLFDSHTFGPRPGDRELYRKAPRTAARRRLAGRLGTP
jgi:hypothetical protein